MARPGIEDREGLADIREKLEASVKILERTPEGEALAFELAEFLRVDVTDAEEWVARIRADAKAKADADTAAETLRTNADEFADLIEQAIGTCYPDEPIELHDIRIALHRFRETNT